LLIVHACSEYREWQPAEAELLQQIADQMAIALKQAELYQQLQKELTDRRQAQLSLRESEALFRSLSESSPVGIFRNDEQGQCIYTNPRYQEITGLTYAETLGEGWQQFIHPEDRENVLPQWFTEMAAKQESSAELRHLCRDGTIRLCQLKSAPILSLNQELLGYVGTIDDITDRRAVEQMKSEFVSIVSHELRTPLASIRGSLGLLASDVLNDDPDTAKHMLTIAAVETERLVRLVSDILDLERLESHKVVLDRQWCDASTLMHQAIEGLQPLADENQIDFNLIPLAVQIWVAPDRLIQTLVNLLSNAIKFSPAESTVTLKAQSQTDHILFQIQDQGRGIPTDKLETVFGRFQQLDASDSRDKGGTGLGLAICRNIVQQHGGQIWVESVVNQGSIFSFTIPIPLE
jgi:PAS domain S-box-containing protein